MRFRAKTIRLWALPAAVLCVGEVSGWTQAATSIPETRTVPDARVRILREIRDPHTGARWLVTANTMNPAGPGRMVQTGGNGGSEAPVVVIHRWDRVVVEEHTGRAEGYLEATALEPASIGSGFRVRLKVGGKVMRAVALAPGRAALVIAAVQPRKAGP